MKNLSIYTTYIWNIPSTIFFFCILNYVTTSDTYNLMEDLTPVSYCPSKSTLQVYSYFIALHFRIWFSCALQCRFRRSFFFTQNKDDCAVEVLVRTFFAIMIRQAAKWNENMTVEKSRLPNKL